MDQNSSDGSVLKPKLKPKQNSFGFKIANQNAAYHDVSYPFKLNRELTLIVLL